MSRRRKARVGRKVKYSDLLRTCPSGKKGWRKEGEAKAQARNMGRSDLRAYLCDDCKEWHLAHPIGRKERRRRAKEGRGLQ